MSHYIEFDPGTMEEKLAGLYSADVITEGRIRGVFVHGGKNYAITSLLWHHGLKYAEGTEAIPIKMWTGNTCKCGEKPIKTDADRERFYEGVKVQCKHDVFVLSGEKYRFVPGQQSAPPAAKPFQPSLF
jgi:hypothetical protein